MMASTKHPKRLFAFVLVLAGILVPCAVTAGQPSIAALDSMFAACHDSDKPGGFAVAVVADGKVAYKKGFGMANTEHGVPFTTSTCFDFASVAKQFTGLAIAMLVTEGKLALDDDIRKHLPQMHDFGTTITIDHLLHHTSGLRDWVALAKLSGRSDDDLIDAEFLRRVAVNQRELNFRPGERHLYSNLGYFLLAEIVERVTGEPFAQWMRANVFEPLEMHDTFIAEQHDAVIANMATSYLLKGDGPPRAARNGLVSPGSSSLVSTVDDMIKWVGNFESGQVGGRAALDLMYTPGATNDGKRVGYAFGLGIYDFQGLVNYDHGGSWRGFLSQVMHFPGQGFSYIFVANRSPSGCYLDGELINLYLGDKSGGSCHGSQPNEDTAVALSGSTPEVIVGRYVRELGHTREFATVTRQDGELFYTDRGGPKLKLSPAKDGAAYHQWREYNFSFGIAQADGDVVLTLVHSSGESQVYRRIAESDPGAEQLTEYTGRYFCEELQTFYDLTQDESGLTLRHFQNGDVALDPLMADFFGTDQWWVNEVIVNRDEDGQVAGFKVNADRGAVTGLLFRKMQ